MTQNSIGTPASDPASDQDKSPSVADIQAEIAHTRADLADTVDQLTAKLDVKTRIRTTVADTKDDAAAKLRVLQDHATNDEGRPTPATLGIGGGVLAAVVAVLVIALWRRNNTPRRPRRRRR